MRQNLNDAGKGLIINLKLNRSNRHNQALKTDFSKAGTKIIKIVQFEEVFEFINLKS